MTLEKGTERLLSSDQTTAHDRTSSQTASERLQMESQSLLKAQTRTTGATRLELDEGTYTIRSGDTLSSIAAKMLRLRGEPVNGRSIYDEVDRITYKNLEKYPWLANSPNKIKPGMKLVAWDRDSGPDTACKWREWKDAEPGKVTVAQRCESIFAGKDTQVVVAPGGRAVFTPGSFGFIAPRGYARVLEGSSVMAVGGDIVSDGGKVQSLFDDVKARRERPRPQPTLISETLSANGSRHTVWSNGIRETVTPIEQRFSQLPEDSV